MIVDKIALIWAIVGALNWGRHRAVRLQHRGLSLRRPPAMLARIIYTVVGLAGLWCITLLFRNTEDSTGRAPHTA